MKTTVYDNYKYRSIPAENADFHGFYITSHRFYHLPSVRQYGHDRKPEFSSGIKNVHTHYRKAFKSWGEVKRATLLGNVRETVDRTGLWQAQTPQIFHTALYQAALVKAEEDKFNVTDDTSLIEHLGYQVRMVECGLANIKITTPADLPIAQAVLDYRSKKK